MAIYTSQEIEFDISRFIPDWADGLVYLVDDDIWRPAKKSKRGFWYSKTTWRPIFGRELRDFGRFLLRIYYNIGSRCGRNSRVIIVTREQKIYFGCASVDSERKYIYLRIYVALG